MSITKYFDILFQVCKGYLVIRASQFWQAALRIVMNTSIYVILETLLVSFWMVKGIEELKGVHMEVKGSSSSSVKKKKNNAK